MVKVAATVQSTIAANREAFYLWLVPGVFFDQLDTILPDSFGSPGVVKTTDTSGPWDTPGSHRTVHLSDGNSAREEVTDVIAPDYFAYAVTEFTNPLIRRLVKKATGQWWFTDDGAGTNAKWVYTFEALSIVTSPLLLPIVKILWKRSMTAAMKIVKERAEIEVPGGSR